MHPLKSVGGTGGSAGGVGCGLFTCGFGIIFLLIGWVGGLPLDLARIHNGQFEYLFGVICYVAFGIFAVGGGLGQIVLFSRLGKTTAGVFHDFLRPGDAFRFLFTQSFRRSVNLKTVGVYLVFRESVSYKDSESTTTHHFDRLVQSFEDPGSCYSAGQMFSAEHRFQMPARDMGLRHPYGAINKITVEAGWLIKVHLVFGKGWEVWRQYELPVIENTGEWARRNDDVSAGDSKEPLFDVHLIDVAPLSPQRTTNVMQEILPHLEGGQVGDLYFARPCLLRENLTEQKAQAMRAQLEAAGATIRVSPAPPPLISTGPLQ